MSLPEGKLLLTNVRLSYPTLYTPEAVKNEPDGKKRYSAKLLLPKSDEAGKAKLDRDIDRIVKSHFKGVRPKQKNICFLDGDGEDGDENTRGYWVISAARSEKQGRPQVVDRSRKAIDSTNADELVYGGSIANAVIELYKPGDWDKICASLEIVQHVKHGERFGAPRVNAGEVMPDLGDEEEEDFEV